LAGHGDAEALLWADEVVMVVGLQVDLDPAYPADEGAGLGVVVVADGVAEYRLQPPNAPPWETITPSAPASGTRT
jgi:hypothetical protein